MAIFNEGFIKDALKRLKDYADREYEKKYGKDGSKYRKHEEEKNLL